MRCQARRPPAPPRFRAPLSWFPPSGSRKVAKALQAGADEVVLDLEDAVVPAAKDAARASVEQVLRGSSAMPLAVRVNPMGTR